MKIPTMTSYDFITLLSVSSFTMGVPTLLTRLPGGGKEIFDFSKLKKDGLPMNESRVKVLQQITNSKNLGGKSELK